MCSTQQKRVLEQKLSRFARVCAFLCQLTKVALRDATSNATCTCQSISKKSLRKVS
jgi:hypothetical protein